MDDWKKIPVSRRSEFHREFKDSLTGLSDMLAERLHHALETASADGEAMQAFRDWNGMRSAIVRHQFDTPPAAFEQCESLLRTALAHASLCGIEAV